MDIRKFWRAALDQDAGAMRAFFHPEAVVRWHCSGERFSVDEYLRANCEYPGEWDGEIQRVEAFADQIITAVRVFPKDKSASFHAVSFFRICDGKIIEMDEYWADDAPPPDWRIQMNIGRKI